MNRNRKERQEIELAALSLLKTHEITSPSVPVERIAQKEGIQVVRSASSWNQSGFLLRDRGHVIIGLNSRNAPVRQRFTIAHEIGHWRLHEGKRLFVDQSVVVNRRDDVSSSGTDEEEIEANAFAAALLMPHIMVMREVTRILETSPTSRESLVSSLAKVFDVSIEAMSLRLTNLGIMRN